MYCIWGIPMFFVHWLLIKHIEKHLFILASESKTYRCIPWEICFAFFSFPFLLQRNNSSLTSYFLVVLVVRRRQRESMWITKSGWITTTQGLNSTIFYFLRSRDPWHGGSMITTVLVGQAWWMMKPSSYFLFSSPFM